MEGDSCLPGLMSKGTDIVWLQKGWRIGRAAHLGQKKGSEPGEARAPARPCFSSEKTSDASASVPMAPYSTPLQTVVLSTRSLDQGATNWEWEIAGSNPANHRLSCPMVIAFSQRSSIVQLTTATMFS